MQILACSWFHVYINLLLLSLLLLLLHLIDDHDVTSFVTHSLIPKEEQREKVHNTSTCTVHVHVHVHIIHKVKHTHKYMYMYICIFVEDFLDNFPFKGKCLAYIPSQKCIATACTGTCMQHESIVFVRVHFNY